MDWEIKVYNKNILYINIYVQISLKLVKELINDLLKKAKELNIFLFIIDLRDLDIIIKPSELFYIPQIVKDIEINYKYKTAILYSKNSKNKSIYLFFEDVAINQALNIKIFTNKKRALEWLEEMK